MASGEVQAQNEGQPKEGGLKRRLSFWKRRKGVSGPVRPAEGETVPPVPPLAKEKKVKFAEETVSSTKHAGTDKKGKSKKATATENATPKQGDDDKNGTQDGDNSKDSAEPQETEAQRRIRTKHVITHAYRDHQLLIPLQFRKEDIDAAKSFGRATRPADIRNYSSGSGQQPLYFNRDTGGLTQANHNEPDGDLYQEFLQWRSLSSRRSYQKHAAKESDAETSLENSHSNSSNSNPMSHRQRRKSHSAAQGQDDIRRRATVSQTSAPASVTKERNRRKSTSNASRPRNVSAEGEASDVVYTDSTTPPPLPESVPVTKERSRRKSTRHADSSNDSQTPEELPPLLEPVPVTKERSRRKSMSSAGHSKHNESLSHATAKSQTTDAEYLEPTRQKTSTPSRSSSRASSKAASEAASQAVAPEVPPIPSIPSILKASSAKRPPPGEPAVPPVSSISADLREPPSRSKSEGTSAVYRDNEEDKRGSTNFSRPGILKSEGRRDTVTELDPPPAKEVGDSAAIGQAFSFPWDQTTSSDESSSVVKANGTSAVKNGTKPHQSRLPRRKNSRFQESIPQLFPGLTQTPPTIHQQKTTPTAKASAALVDLMDAPATAFEQDGPFVGDSVQDIMDADVEHYVMSGALGDMDEMRDDSSSVYESEGEDDLMAFEEYSSESDRIWEEEVF